MFVKAYVSSCFLLRVPSRVRACVRVFYLRVSESAFVRVCVSACVRVCVSAFVSACVREFERVCVCA